MQPYKGVEEATITNHFGGGALEFRLSYRGQFPNLFVWVKLKNGWGWWGRERNKMSLWIEGRWQNENIKKKEI